MIEHDQQNNRLPLLRSEMAILRRQAADGTLTPANRAKAIATLEVMASAPQRSIRMAQKVRETLNVLRNTAPAGEHPREASP